MNPHLLQQYFNSKTHLSQSTLNKQKIALHDMFEKAIQNDLIYKNPMKAVTIPNTKPAKTRSIWDEGTANTALAFAKTHPKGLGVVILLKTGLRRGELVGLKWSDFDFDENILYIQRSVRHKIKGDGKSPIEIVSSNKIKNHQRCIPFNDDLKMYLLSIERKSEYVIADESGNMITPNSYSKYYFNPVINDLIHVHPDIPRLTPHELRHTYGTMLREKEIDIYTISRVLGHSDVSTTEKVYVKNTLSALKNAMKKAF